MAAIGLDDQELEKIAPLCGTLRPANSPDTYAHEYSWTETDLAVVMDHNIPFGLSVNVLAIGAGKPRQNKASQRAGAGLAVVRPKRLIRGPERETRVMMEDHGDCADSCPANAYISLATELSKQLHRTDTLVPVVPPHMRPTGARSEHILIASTSGQPVAIRQVHTWSQGPYNRCPATTRGYESVGVVPSLPNRRSQYGHRPGTTSARPSIDPIGLVYPRRATVSEPYLTNDKEDRSATGRYRAP